MPLPTDLKFYEAMATQADVISAAIDSLDVQVSWSGLRVDGVADPSKFDPLFAAFTDYGGAEEALASFTQQIFCFGNVAVFCFNGRGKVWPPAWRFDPAYQPYAAQGALLEARNPPIVNDFGTPILEPALAAFKAYWAQQAASIRALEAYVRSPVGVPPTRGVRADEQARNAVLLAMGFEPRSDDLPHYLNPSKLRGDMKGLFEAQILRPFASMLGVNGAPSLAI
ncbi:MAG: hypothetical protein KC776_18980 [Myxococcales bacterium]|nr:hypothetical protein [Myxococcales bacterium]MCB9576671.1 hypothetical protein [Polyangiaceae bacterium]